MRTTICTAIVFGALAARGESVKLVYSAALYADAKDVQLKAPEGVACAAGGRLVVADSGNGRLLSASFNGSSFAGAQELKAPQLARPTRVQIDAQGDLLVLDARKRRIGRLGAGGEWKGYLEPRDVPGDTALAPVAFRLGPAGQVVLLDVLASRVVVLDATGGFQRTLPLPPGEFVDVSAGPQGTLYLVDPVNAIVYAAAPAATSFTPFSKALRQYASFPVFAEPAEGRLMVVDSHGGGVVILGPDGSFLGRQLGAGRGEGTLYYPSQICLDGNGTLLVADRDNNRVQAFSIAR